MEENQKKYEITFVCREEGDGEAIGKILVKHNAKILNEKTPEKIKLSYPIKKENSAYLGTIAFVADRAVLAQIKDEIKTSNLLLRFNILNAPVLQVTLQRRDKKEAELRAKKAEAEAVAPLKAKEEVLVADKPEDPYEEARRPSQPYRTELSNEALEKKLEELLKE